MWKNTALAAAQCAKRPEMVARLAPHYERAKDGGQPTEG
jgi:hypothetical protein